MNWILFFLLFCSSSFGITIFDLIQEQKQKAVEIEAEVVGKLIKRGNFYLLNINDKTGGIGVFIKIDKCPKIEYYGRYGVIGDRIRVFGIFHPVCKEHWGKMDIHSSSIEVLEKGKIQKERINKNRILLLFALTLASLLLIMIHKRRFRRED
ncbi:MAG: hypothetical protein AB1630_07985 [bacterium]